MAVVSRVNRKVIGIKQAWVNQEESSVFHRLDHVISLTIDSVLRASNPPPLSLAYLYENTHLKSLYSIISALFWGRRHSVPPVFVLHLLDGS